MIVAFPRHVSSRAGVGKLNRPCENKHVRNLA
jgi:hypothetical protein